MSILLIPITAYLVAYALIPPITSGAKRFGAIDIPDARKIHSGHVPRLGGIGIVAAFAVSVLIANPLDAFTAWHLAALAVIVATGIVDDTKGVSPAVKFGGQFIAAAIAVVFMDIGFSFSLPVGWVGNAEINAVISIIWIVGVTNAVNLIDGMDGLSGGISVVAYGAMAVAGIHAGQDTAVIWCLALIGGTLGFLRYNLPPAKVFMGDTGSLFLGFNIGVLSLIVSYKSGTILSVVVPFLFISLPVIDTFLAIIRRLSRGQSPFQPDREHLHHKLLDLRLSATQALVIFYALSVALGLLAALVRTRDVVWGVIGSVLLIYLLLAAIAIVKRYRLEEALRAFNHRWSLIIGGEGRDALPGTSVFAWWVNGAIAAATVAFVLMAAVAAGVWTGSDLVLLYTYAAALVVTLFARPMKVRNDFGLFVLYWIFFACGLLLAGSTLRWVGLSLAGVLYLMVGVKVVARRRFDLVIAHPMELLQLFFCVIAWQILALDDGVFIAGFVMSVAAYAANKVFFGRKGQDRTPYRYVLVGLVLCMPLFSLVFS